MKPRKASSFQYLLNKYLVDGFLTKLPLIGTHISEFARLKTIASACGYPPGHFYSPIPSPEEVKQDSDRIFADKKPLSIDINIDAQKSLLTKFQVYRSEFPYDLINGNEDPNLRYKWLHRPQYRYSDVVFLYNFVRHFRPKRIIEIGSGSSSAVILDTNELFFDASLDLTFIDPLPERLLGFMTESDRISSKVYPSRVQDLPISVFSDLKENDILFVDSSHVAKVGSDVNHIFFEILPRLRTGVLVHFHDVFYPFELPKHWILSHKRYWNESYLLRAFLMYNDSWKISFCNTLLQRQYRSFFAERMPECLIDEADTGSIWISKTR